MQDIFSMLSSVSLVFQIIGLYILLTTVLYLYKYFKTQETIKAWYKKKLIINVSILTVGVIIYVLLFGFLQNTFGISQGGGVPVPRLPGSSYSGSAQAISQGISIPSYYRESPYSYPTQPTNTNISDTREFIKQSYSARLKTRAVEEVAKKVELLIKGVGGRIDSSNSSETSAYISFVIPKKELDGFEEQMRTYVNKKFYSQSISSQNLLSDKQQLEQRQQTNSETLSTLDKQKKEAQDTYTKNANALKAQLQSKQTALNKVTTDIARKEGEINATTDPQKQTLLQTELRGLIDTETVIATDIKNLNSNLDQTTKAFTTQMNTLGVSLSEQKTLLTTLDKQEDTFFDNVETVQGSISINFVSLWEIFNIYSPINPIVLIAIILILLNLYSTNKKEKELLATQ